MALQFFHLGKFFKDLRLRERILLGYSIPVLLSLLSAIFVYIQGVKQVEIRSQEVEILHRQVGDVKNLALSISAMQRAARGYLLGENENELREYEAWDTYFYEQSEKLRVQIKGSQQQETLNKIIAVGDNLNELNRRLISYLKLGKSQKVKATWQAGNLQRIAQSLNELVRVFEALEQQQLTSKRIQQEKALQFLIFVVFGFAGLSAILAILIGMKITSTVGRHMNQETSAIAASASEIAATMAQQERNTTVMATSVSQVTATLDELNSSFQKAAEQAENSALKSQSALSISQTGTKAVHHTLTRMSIIREKVETIAQQEVQLQEKSAQIETIARLVSELANQTNMLALNAAIEAVRPGQHQGFAVIANEIRHLADQSKQSASDINRLITDIQNAVKMAGVATLEGTKTVEKSVKIAQEMADAFVSMAEKIEQVVFSSQQISLNAQQQAIALQQLVEAMNAINQAVQENSLGTIQVRIGTERLYQALQNLNALI